MTVNLDKIPLALRESPQWIVWKLVKRDGDETKVPFQVTGKPAKANDPSTWSTFDEAAARFTKGGYVGPGYEFSAADPFCGIDLDGCRNRISGEVQPWAKEIIKGLDTYAEVSPSQTGVKLFIRATLPTGVGRKKILSDVPKCGTKEPAIEVYDRGRYFAVTGMRLSGPHEPQERQSQLDALVAKFFPPAATASAEFYSPQAVVERARKYLVRLPCSVSGQDGHKAAFHAACVLVLGFGLNESDALGLLREWNATCQPPWSERELLHKVSDAMKEPGERNYLRNAQQERWDNIRVRQYEPPAERPAKKQTDLATAAKSYLQMLSEGKETLIETGLPDLDYAIGGGVAPGEMIIFAARTSHGKTAVALQCAHNWTRAGMPTILISEEMSAMALGKRAIQYVSDVPQEHWRTSIAEVAGELDYYEQHGARCIIVESCREAEVAAAEVVKAVEQHKVQCAIIDYATLLQSKGKSRYEQMTNTSVTLRQLASSQNIVLVVLCQMNREIEKDKGRKFMPNATDLRDTGQFEQDADVIVFCVWPHQIDKKHNPHEYQFFVAKNRNRPINQYALTCRFEPSRQMLLPPKPVFDHRAIASGEQFNPDAWSER